MRHTFTTIGMRLASIVGLVLLLVALWVLGRGSIGTTFAMGALQLQVDSYATYNGVVQPALTWAMKDLVPGVDKFFNFDDIKPGDRGTNVISLHTNEHAWACLDFSNLVDHENGNNEPEGLEDADGLMGGELSRGIEFFSWFDDGVYTYEVGEVPLFGTATPQAGFDVLTSYSIADGTTGSMLAANNTKYIGIQWCAGDLHVNTGTAAVTCNGGALGNWAQTDSFSVDLGLRVVTADDYPGYRCDGSVPPPPQGKTVTLNLEKKFSGPVPDGYLPEHFSFRVVGPGTDRIVTLTPYTRDSANGTINLATGTYAITEIPPADFVPNDWRPGWYGECLSGTAYTTTITINESNIDDGTLYCQVDNQYRPKKKPKPAQTVTAPPPAPAPALMSASSGTSATGTTRTNRPGQTPRR